MPGIAMSSRISSGPSVRASSSAISPLSASPMSAPASASAARSTLRIEAWSSTMRMRREASGAAVAMKRGRSLPRTASGRFRRCYPVWAMAGDDDREGGGRGAVREREMRAAGRLPPGQSLTVKWPVLHDGDVPRFDPATWDFRVGGLVDAPLTLSWPEFLALPRVEVTSDFHCVTRWSTFDNRWQGVPVRAVLERARPRAEATHVMVCGHKDETRYGYTTNLPRADFDRAENLFVLRQGGRDLAPEHAGPLR